MDYRGHKSSATITYRGSGRWKWARGTPHMWSKNAIKCKLGGHNLKNGAPNLKNGAPYFQKGTPNFTIPHPNENLFEYWFNPQNGVLSPKNLIIAKNFAPAARPFHFLHIFFIITRVEILQQQKNSFPMESLWKSLTKQNYSPHLSVIYWIILIRTL